MTEAHMHTSWLSKLRHFTTHLKRSVGWTAATTGNKNIDCDKSGLKLQIRATEILDNKREIMCVCVCLMCMHVCDSGWANKKPAENKAASHSQHSVEATFELDGSMHKLQKLCGQICLLYWLIAVSSISCSNNVTPSSKACDKKKNYTRKQNAKI